MTDSFDCITRAPAGRFDGIRRDYTPADVRRLAADRVGEGA